MPKKKGIDDPQKLDLPLVELEALSRLKDFPEWKVAKRVANRYIANLMRKSFKLPEDDPHRLASRHAEYAGQVMGLKTFFKIIAASGKKRDEVESS